MSDAQSDFYQSGSLVINDAVCGVTHLVATHMPAEEIQVRIENCRLLAEIANMRRLQAEMQQKLATFQPGYGDQVDDGPVDTTVKVIPFNALRHRNQKIGLLTFFD